MASWANTVDGQDGRVCYVQVRRNGRTWRKKPLAVATTYTSQALANAAVTTALSVKDTQPIATRHTVTAKQLT